MSLIVHYFTIVIRINNMKYFNVQMDFISIQNYLCVHQNNQYVDSTTIKKLVPICTTFYVQVNCQYEPPMDMNSIPMIKSSTIYMIFSERFRSVCLDTICRDYVSGTYLPVANKLDEFVVCEDDGTSTVKKCQAGLRYNALSTKCEKRNSFSACFSFR